MANDDDRAPKYKRRKLKPIRNELTRKWSVVAEVRHRRKKLPHKLKGNAERKRDYRFISVERF